MMSKKLVSFLGIVILLVTTSQDFEPERVEFHTQRFNYKDLENLYVFFERSSYYLSEHLQNDELTRLFNELNEIYGANEGLISSALKLTKNSDGSLKKPKDLGEVLDIMGIEKQGEQYVRKKLPSFIHEVDPLMGTILTAKELSDNPRFEVVYQLLKRNVVRNDKKLEKFLTELEDGSLKLTDYLPPNLKRDFERDKKNLENAAAGTAVKIAGTYASTFLILHKLKPSLRKLLKSIESDAEFKEQLIREYVRVVSEGYLIEIVSEFVLNRENDHVVSVLVGGLEKMAELRDRLKEWKEYRKVPGRLKQSQKNAGQLTASAIAVYRKSFNNEYYALREEIISQATTLLSNTVGALKKEIGKEIKSIVTENGIAKTAAKYVRTTSERTDQNFFIDIKENAADKTWLRIKIPDADKNRLLENNNANDVTGDFYLVYKPDVTVPNNLQVAAKGFVLDNKNQVVSKQQVRDALKELYIEVPIGLILNNLSLQIKEGSSGVQLIEFQDGRERKHPLKVNLPNHGLWARFVQEREKWRAFEERFQLTSSMSISISNIEPIFRSDESVDVQFTFKWQLPASVGAAVSEVVGTDAQEVTVLFSELRELSLDEDNLKRVLRNEVTKKIDTILQSNTPAIQEALQSFLPVTSLTDLKFNYVESFVRGTMNVMPLGSEFLGIDRPIPVSFEVAATNGYPELKMVAPALSGIDLEKNLRNQLESLVREIPLVRDSEQVFSNVMNALNINDIQWDNIDKGLCVNMSFEFLDANVPLNYCIGKGDDPIQLITEQLKEVIKKYSEELAKNYLNQVASDACQNLLQDDINVFGLKFDIDQQRSDCSSTVYATTTVPSVGSINIELQRDGSSLKLTKFDAEQVKKAVDHMLNQTLNQLGFIQFSNYSFKQQKFSTNLKMDLRPFGFNHVEDLGELTIDVNGKIETSKLNNPFANFEDYLEQLGSTLIAQMVASMQNEINQEIQANRSRYLLDFAGQALQLNSVVIDYANTRTLKLKGDILLNKGEIPIPVIFEFTLDPFRLRSVKLDGPVESAIQQGINTGANYLAGLVCATCLKIDPFTFDENDWYKPISITGTLALNIPDLFAVPAIKFQLTKDGLDFDLKPRIPFPAPIPVGTTGFVLVYTFAEIDIEERIFKLATSLTVGAGYEAYETAKLARFDMSASINFKKLNRIDFTGDMVIVNMALIYGGGHLDFGKAEFEFYQRTPVFLEDLLNYNTLVRVNAKKKNAIGQANVGLLGVKANLNVTAQVESYYTNIKADGNVDLPVATFSGNLRTKFIPYMPLSWVLTSEASLQSSFHIGDFDISKASVKASIHRADLRFKFLDARLGVTVPMLDALDEDLILDMILGMFDFDPEMLADFLSNLDKTEISLKNIDVSFGTPEFYAGDGIGIGNGGDDDEFGEIGEEGEGGVKLTSTEGIDNSLNGGLPSGHSPFRYSSAKVDAYKLEHHRNCRKFKFGPFKVTWRCKNYTVKRELYKPNNWEGQFTTLPSGFRNYYAVFNPAQGYDPTGFRMYDLYSANVHQFVGGSTKLFIRAPIELEQRYHEGKYYLCASKEGFVGGNSLTYSVPLKGQISQEVLNQIHLYGNLAYGSGNQPIKIWTSVGINPADGVNYLNPPDSATQTKSPTLLAEDGHFGKILLNVQNDKKLKFIPFDRSSQEVPSEIPIMGEALSTYKVNIRRGKYKSLLSRSDEKIEAVEELIQETPYIAPRPDQAPALFEVLLAQFAEYNPSEIKTVNDTIEIEDYRAFTEYAGDFLVEPKHKKGTLLVLLDNGILAVEEDAAVSIRQAQDAKNSPLSSLRNAVYQLAEQIRISIPGNAQPPINSILAKGQIPGSTANAKLRALNSTNFPRVANALMEYIQNRIAFGRSTEPVYVSKQAPKDHAFTAWNTSTSSALRDWSWSYVIESEAAEFEYVKTSLDSCDLTRDIGVLTNNIDTQRNLLNTNGSLYYKVVQKELAHRLEYDSAYSNRILLSASPFRLVYGNMEENDRFSLTVMSPTDTKVKKKKQVHLLNENISADRFHYPYQFNEHQAFFAELMDEIATTTSESYIKKISKEGTDSYVAVIFEGSDIKVYWEQTTSKDDEEIVYRVKEWDPRTPFNGNDGATRNAQQIENLHSSKWLPTHPGASSEEQIARYIINGFEGFNEWGEREKNKINPLSVLRKLN